MKTEKQIGAAEHMLNGLIETQSDETYERFLRTTRDALYWVQGD